MNSFYQYVEKYRSRSGSENGPYAVLAEKIYADRTFPKDASDFDKLSHYLEMDERYQALLETFDDLYQDYILETK